MRTITEILKDADNAKTHPELEALWREIVENKYEYTLVQLEFAKEHIDKKVVYLLEEDTNKVEQLTFNSDKKLIVEELQSVLNDIANRYRDYTIQINIKIKRNE